MFEIGLWYENNLGKYQVLTIDGDKMSVRYVDGHQQVLSVRLQRRIQEGRTIKQEVGIIRHIPVSLRHTGKSYSAYWTLGFVLSRLAHFGANVKFGKKSRNKVQFLEHYYKLTGIWIKDDNHSGICFLPEGANQWGHQGVFVFRASPSELLLLRFHNTPRLTSYAGVYEVKDIHFFWFALEHGLRPGSIQNVGEVEKSIPTMYQDAYSSGYLRGLS